MMQPDLNAVHNSCKIKNKKNEFITNHRKLIEQFQKAPLLCLKIQLTIYLRIITTNLVILSKIPLMMRHITSHIGNQRPWKTKANMQERPFMLKAKSCFRRSLIKGRPNKPNKTSKIEAQLISWEIKDLIWIRQRHLRNYI